MLMSTRRWIILTVVTLAVALTAWSSVHVVPVYQHAIVLQFGRVVDTHTEPGLYFKLPFIQNVVPVDNRLRPWDGESSDLLTVDKENITVDTWARWRVTDPQLFYEAIKTEAAAQGVLDGLIEASVKNVISSQELMEVLRNTDRRLKYTSEELEEAEAEKNVEVTVGREEVVGRILTQSAEDTREQYGLEIEGLAIKQFNYVQAVIPKIYERMRSERTRIADRYESEGRERKARILGEVAKELEEIESEGYRKAKRIRGQADAEVLRIYAEAYGQDPEFYSFSRTLELYPTLFDEEARLVLSTEDNDLLRYLKSWRSARKDPPKLRAVPNDQ